MNIFVLKIFYYPVINKPISPKYAPNKIKFIIINT